MKADATVVDRLRAAGCVFAEEEAEVLAATATSAAELGAMVARRAAGEPLEHVAGWASFAGLRVGVDRGVFVPRRRSEFLVAVAARLARAGRPAPGAGTPGGTADLAGSPVIVDLCCGTGALGLAVARELGGHELHAADLDPAAVACARRNIGPAGGQAYQGNLFGALPVTLRGRVTVLICNAPYVPSGEVAFLPTEARDHEPRLALDGGADGLGILRQVAVAAPQWLAPGGVLLVEASSRQAPAMVAAMSAAGLRARAHSDDEHSATVVTGRAQGGVEG